MLTILIIIIIVTLALMCILVLDMGSYADMWILYATLAWSCNNLWNGIVNPKEGKEKQRKS